MRMCGSEWKLCFKRQTRRGSLVCGEYPQIDSETTRYATPRERTPMLIKLSRPMVTFFLFALSVGHAANSLQRIETHVIELNRFGFSPKQIHSTKGVQGIYVRNLTGLKNLTLVLLDQAGKSQNQKSLAPGSPHWRGVLTLTPGTYTLTETAHPDWTCTISVK
jgi:hypothetical protein